jgi:hypothetical protein
MNIKNSNVTGASFQRLYQNDARRHHLSAKFEVLRFANSSITQSGNMNQPSFIGRDLLNVHDGTEQKKGVGKGKISCMLHTYITFSKLLRNKVDHKITCLFSSVKGELTSIRITKSKHEKTIFSIKDGLLLLESITSSLCITRMHTAVQVSEFKVYKTRRNTYRSDESYNA